MIIKILVPVVAIEEVPKIVAELFWADGIGKEAIIINYKEVNRIVKKEEGDLIVEGDIEVILEGVKEIA